MPGFLVSSSIFLEQGVQREWEKYRCSYCCLLLRDAVQPFCGHWLCETCAQVLFQEATGENCPRCPRKDCGEELVEYDGLDYFPDRFVRREIRSYNVQCLHHDKGCDWVGNMDASYQDHVTKECAFAEQCPCQFCGQLEPDGHKDTCPNASQQCPLVGLGCQDKTMKTRSELVEHVDSPEAVLAHFNCLATAMKEFDNRISKLETRPRGVCDEEPPFDTSAYGSEAARLYGFISSWSPETLSSSPERVLGFVPQPENGSPNAMAAKVFPVAPETTSSYEHKLLEKYRMMDRELGQFQDEEMDLEAQVTELTKQLQIINAELEDQDRRLSLIENSSFDGTIVWKIPQFEQRMADARSGKCTSIFSLPFYTGCYGYKMCLRLYILGDGIGRNTHMSLFFVILRGEFDDRLPWPFTHRVTFKLINQRGGSDVFETFQPDPASSSFRKPKLDMNVASGCPKFVSLQVLHNGFVADDTIHIRCAVDCSRISAPLT